MGWVCLRDRRFRRNGTGPTPCGLVRTGVLLGVVGVPGERSEFVPFLEAGRSSSDADSYGGQLNPRLVAVLRRARVGAPSAGLPAPLSLDDEAGAVLSQIERIESDKARL